MFPCIICNREFPENEITFHTNRCLDAISSDDEENKRHTNHKSFLYLDQEEESDVDRPGYRESIQPLPNPPLSNPFVRKSASNDHKKDVEEEKEDEIDDFFMVNNYEKISKLSQDRLLHDKTDFIFHDDTPPEKIPLPKDSKPLFDDVEAVMKFNQLLNDYDNIFCPSIIPKQDTNINLSKLSLNSSSSSSSSYQDHDSLLLSLRAKNWKTDLETFVYDLFAQLNDIVFTHQNELSELKIRSLSEQDQELRMISSDYKSKELELQRTIDNLGSEGYTLIEEKLAYEQDELVLVPIQSSVHFSPEKRAYEYHFRLAESQFLRMFDRTQYSGKNGLYVQQVDVILNPKLMKRYQDFIHNHPRPQEDGQKVNTTKNVKYHNTFRELLVFHGTNSESIEKICQEGFKIGGNDTSSDGVPITNGSVYGKGIYSTQSSSFAMQYIKDQNCCRLLFARVYATDDSVIIKKNNVIEQIVVHSVDQILPYYIIHLNNIIVETGTLSLGGQKRKKM